MLNLNYNYTRESAAAASQNIKERDYWLNKLSGELVKSNFPYDYQKNGSGQQSLDSLKLSFAGETYSTLMKLSKGSDYTLQLVLITAMTLLLNKYTGNNDIIVGMPIYRQEFEGEFINTVLALRNPVKGNMTFRELLLQVRQTILEAVENQNYPIEALLYQLDLQEQENDFPLFDVAILLENIHDKHYLQHISPNMVVSFLRTDRKLECCWEYNSLRFNRVTIEQIIGHLPTLLNKALNDIDTLTIDIDILSYEERKQLLLDFNNNKVDFPKDKTVCQLFAERAAAAPDLTALIFEGSHVTYGELNQRANRLARFLRNNGLQREELVGIMLDRSPRMVESILAVWKAGGAYFPVDPGYPLERIKYMLQKSQSPVLLTDTSAAENFSYTDLKDLLPGKVEIYKTGLRPQIVDFDGIPVPDRSLVNYEKYNEYIGHAAVKNSISVQATRGCPYNCLYCHKIWPKRHVFRSAENIFAEVLSYYKLGVRRFSFVDDIFNLNEKNSRRFFELVIENQLDIHIFFPNGLRGDLLTKDYIDLMIEAGVTSFALALETASPRLQKLIGKNLDLKKLRENIEYICEKYPHVILELFTMHGFPTETEEEAMQTLDFIKSLKWLHFPYVNILIIYSNTKMEKLALENGISQESIYRSEVLSEHEFLDTVMPFKKDFTLKYQTDFLSNYFLLKERLLQVLPYQMKVLTEDEIVQKYNSYLPNEINRFSQLLEFVGITMEELGVKGCLDEEHMYVPDLNRKLEKVSVNVPQDDACESTLKVLLLDLSQLFSQDSTNRLQDQLEPPLGLMYLLTYLNNQFGVKINGKIAKSKIDFDNYEELKDLLDEFKPDVIGVRSLTYYRDFFHKTIAMIRQWGIGTPIIAGGPYATSSYAAILQDRNIDVVVLGEGEITFSEVIGKIMENEGKLPGEDVLKEISGIAFVSNEAKKQKNFARNVIVLDEINKEISRESEKNPEPVHQPSHMAYVIFTSGSTGKPKGAMVEHLGMMNHMQAKINDLHLSGHSIIAQNASHTFDISVWQLFAALTQGGKTVIYPNDLILEPDRFIARIIQDHVTVLEVVPSYLSTMLDILEIQGTQPLPLDFLLVTGETVKPQSLRQWFEKYPTIKVVNAYGPTEASDDITHYIMHKEPAAQRIPIGKPIQNLNIYIVDKNLKLCPIGVKGEICVSGVGVGRGYYNDEEKTREVFLEDPFIKEVSNNGKKARFYKTGDLGCWLPDGNIEFFGRKDSQVKIRGYRIEPEEIEVKLSDHPGIKETVVVEKTDDHGNNYLCAYMVTNRKLEISQIRDYLLESLPDYMVPAHLIELENIPLTPNGKVDKKALPEPEIDVEEEYVAPRDELEDNLANIWAEVLEMPKNRISIYANFFQLGGHSLSVTIMAARIQKEMGVKVRLLDVFNSPTIRELAEHIKNNAKENKFDSIEAVEKKEYYALSSAQKRMYISQQMQLENRTYNVPQAAVLEGEPDREKLESCFRQTIQRHESLRTSFQIVNGEPVQIIHEFAQFAVEYYEVDEEESKEIYKRFTKPFNLHKAPLLRAALVRTGKDKHVLVVDLHHIISDGFSEDILIRDFMKLYAGEKLTPLRLQYKDFSQWQNKKKQIESIKKQEAYWLEQFKGEIPVLNLVTDYKRPSVKSYEGGVIGFDINSDITRRLNQLALQEKTTLFMVLLSLCYVFLAKLSKQEEIVVGTVAAGRRHADLHHIIGMFVNTLALKNFPRGEKTFQTFLKEVNNRTLEVYENQDYPLDHLVEKVVDKRTANREALFDVMFQFRSMGKENVEMPGLKLKPFKGEYNIVQFDLVFNGTEIGDRVNFSIMYSTQLFEKETIQLWRDRFLVLVESVLKDVQCKIKNLDFTTALEKELRKGKRQEVEFDF